MDRNDQQAIADLFEKLASVERQTPSRDAEAERFINDLIARQPGAPYYMAQTIVVQARALNAAQSRIEELEQQTQQSAGGGLLGGLVGGSGAMHSGSAPPRRRSRFLAIIRRRRAAGFSPAPRRLRWAWPAACFSATRSRACSAEAKRRQPSRRHNRRRRAVPTGPTIPVSTMAVISAMLNSDSARCGWGSWTSATRLLRSSSSRWRSHGRLCG
ncbi:uncharacterized protein DUF2076 [Mesorhizobium tianshanense]|uniref:Uncharacterized protein DUF2076 n=1 Tax=Mesorhizobium tianshanense TaxID=39844 RepID=A0A562P3Z1_9HYPH|nr:uncharacterized protein DUF2076 [Mesorhizobium tianshanense]